jgi:hypothetical protein
MSADYDHRRLDICLSLSVCLTSRHRAITVAMASSRLSITAVIQFDVDAIQRVMSAKTNTAMLGVAQRASKEEITKA